MSLCDDELKVTSSESWTFSIGRLNFTNDGVNVFVGFENDLTVGVRRTHKNWLGI